MPCAPCSCYPPPHPSHPEGLRCPFRHQRRNARSHKHGPGGACAPGRPDPLDRHSAAARDAGLPERKSRVPLRMLPNLVSHAPHECMMAVASGCNAGIMHESVLESQGSGERPPQTPLDLTGVCTFKHPGAEAVLQWGFTCSLVCAETAHAARARQAASRAAALRDASTAPNLAPAPRRAARRAAQQPQAAHAPASVAQRRRRVIAARAFPHCALCWATTRHSRSTCIRLIYFGATWAHRPCHQAGDKKLSCMSPRRHCSRAGVVSAEGPFEPYSSATKPAQLAHHLLC